MSENIKFGGYFYPFPQHKSISHIENAEATLRRKIEVVMWYQQWGTPFSGKNFHPNWVKSVGDRDVLIKWEPKKSLAKPSDTSFSVTSIAAGKFDKYIERWAKSAATVDKQIYLCPMNEMNGFWFGWSKVIGGHSPKDYIAAWKHMYDIFLANDATNVQWVWAPNTGDMPADNRLEDYYPGSEYVDVLGLSVYNWGTARKWTSWHSFQEIVRPYYDRISKLGEQAIWVTEMGCSPEGGDKQAWIQDMWEYLPQLPRLEALLWFNMKKETDWRATETPEAFWP